MLNIQLLAIRSSSHSSSSSKCVEKNAYNEKLQFAQKIIQDIDRIGTFTVEFLCKSKRCWHAKEQTKLGTTTIDLMCIEESEEDEAEKQHFVEAQTMQKDVREENIVAKKEQLST